MSINRRIKHMSMDRGAVQPVYNAQPYFPHANLGRYGTLGYSGTRRALGVARSLANLHLQPGTRPG